jgi:hypothetical protein
LTCFAASLRATPTSNLDLFNRLPAQTISSSCICLSLFSFVHNFKMFRAAQSNPLDDAVGEFESILRIAAAWRSRAIEQCIRMEMY